MLRFTMTVNIRRSLLLSGFLIGIVLPAVAQTVAGRGLAARDENLAAFDGRCIPVGSVAPPSNIPDILGRRALPTGRLARLGATPDFHHGLLASPQAPASAATGEGTRAAAPPASPDEPMAAAFSPQKAADYLDAIAVAWTRERKCGTCHTNYAYMMGRPALGRENRAIAGEIRSFFADKVAQRSSNPPLPHALILAGVLSINDAETTRHLDPITRQALDRMWELQGPDGAWEYPTSFYSPPLGDSYYGAAFAALAVGIAPDRYADTPAARAGMEKLRHYLTSHRAPSLHHQSILLWASTKTPGLLTAEQQAATIRELLQRQRGDGGWSLRSLGDWKRRDGSLNNPDAASDGYATGLVVYVLRQAGLSATDDAIVRGAAWLKTHQRQSGRWFTFSLNTDERRDDNRYTDHLISNIGTAYAVMALRACGELQDTDSR